MIEIYEIKYEGEIYKIFLDLTDKDFVYWIEYPGGMVGSDHTILGEKTKQQVIELALKDICYDDEESFTLLKRDIKLDEILN